MYQSPNSPPSVKRRQAVEIEILTAVLDEALRQGLSISVYDGGEHFAATTDRPTLLDQLFNTDEDVIFVYQGTEQIGWVKFVYGNDGWDVVSDYTTNLESIMGPADVLSKKYE